LGNVEMGAHYIWGTFQHQSTSPKRDFHIQLSSTSVADDNKSAAVANRYAPDVIAYATRDQLLGSANKILLVCAVLGELPTDCGAFRTNRNQANPFELGFSDRQEEIQALWEHMEQRTFQVIENYVGARGKVEYWVQKSRWSEDRPAMEDIRGQGTVHEGSMLWISDKNDSPVGLDYRPRNETKTLDNIYVTGASLWPVGGAWNPTMTMCALAQDLADKLLAHQ